jgi:glycolate oxidase
MTPWAPQQARKSGGKATGNLRAFKREAIALLGRRFVLDTPEMLSTYERDACLLMRGRPHLVTLPATTAQVARLVALCHQYHLGYIARGAGTGLSGGALALGGNAGHRDAAADTVHSEGGVIIGLSRLDRILHIDPATRTATVEVGVVNARLNQALAPYGLFYAPDPSSMAACTLGGNVAENAGGIHCLKYGVTGEHVLGVTVVLPQGERVRLGSLSRRRPLGPPDWLSLLVGSEGTLGIVTEVTLRALCQPPETRVALAAFDTLAAATDCVSAIIAQGLNPAALELIDGFTLRAVNAAFHVGFPEASQAVLLVEFSGGQDEVAGAAQTLDVCLQTFAASQVRWAHTAPERDALWRARKGAVAAYGRYMPAFYLHDCVIPRSELTHVLGRIAEIATAHDVRIGNVFHAGDGNLHPCILFDPQDAALVKRVLAAGEDILALCLSVGGALTGEHGVGIEKAHLMPRVFTQADMARMRAVKDALDPAHLANPGKIFPVGGRGCGELSPTACTAQDALWV